MKHQEVAEVAATIFDVNPEITVLCFAKKTKAASGVPGEHHNYEFVQLIIDGEEVRGSWRTYPYGTDRMEASLTGVYKPATGEINARADMLSEGEFYNQARSFRILDEALQLDYEDQQQKPATLPQVSRNEFDKLLKEFHAGILQRAVNTSDRSRLLKVSAFREMGLTREDVGKVKFMEREVNLDRDYTTNEYLLFVMDPMVCGSGGCNLFVINDEGDILSKTTVVKLPVYTTAVTIDDQQKYKGSWKELYAWSNGMRRLTPDGNGRYPANASVQFPVVKEQISLHPEQFDLLLDYLD